MSAGKYLAVAALLAASAASAQQRTACDDDSRSSIWRGSRGHACEVRELTRPAQGALSIDAGPNGSISIKGENRRDVLVRATVEAWARDDAEAQRIVDEIE